MAAAATLACDRASTTSPPAPGASSATNGGPVPAPSHVDDLAPVLEPIRKGASLPALAAAVFRGPHIVAQGAVGVRKLGDPTAVTIHDKWHVGSNTKAMTATLAAMLVEEKKLELATPLPTLLPGVTMDDAYKKVDLDMLLSHRAGVPPNFPDDLRAKLWDTGDPRDQRREATAALLARKPALPPGTAVSYSNAGYVVAATALERALGTSWERAIRAKLFERLNMGSCGFGSPGAPGKVDQPWGHDTRGGGAKPVEPGPRADNPPPEGPSGRVHCSLADYGRFLALHMAGARGEATILSGATLKDLQTPRAADHALGWLVAQRPWTGGAALTHSGSNTMFYFTAWVAPAKNLAFVVATNVADDAAKRAVDDTFSPLIERYAR
jgi:CubicO group peptidase (beta-lactamase class C family)